jgi:hypothetical protein
VQHRRAADVVEERAAAADEARVLLALEAAEPDRALLRARHAQIRPKLFFCFSRGSPAGVSSVTATFTVRQTAHFTRTFFVM